MANNKGMRMALLPVHKYTGHHHPEAILEAYCRKSNIVLMDLVGTNRRREIVRHRQAAAYYLHLHCKLGPKRIAPLMNKNHATVRDAIVNVEAWVNYYSEYRLWIESVNPVN